MFISPERRCIDPHTCLIRALVGNEMFALELDMQVVEGGGQVLRQKAWADESTCTFRTIENF